VKNQIAKALVERIIEAAQEGKKFKVSTANQGMTSSLTPAAL